ncbi:MAG: hypothetical protein LBE37_19265 [Sphingobacterium sp.]|nr:hypothetical protein [Sphingobacterium sp.]
MRISFSGFFIPDNGICQKEELVLYRLSDRSGRTKSNKLQSLPGGLGGSYIYDLNGNAKTGRTGMTFTYNHLNLPVLATDGGVTVSYLYDDMGTKLCKTATGQRQRDYVGGIEHNGSRIDLIHRTEGVASRSGA